MPFQPINFANIEPEGAPFFRNLVQTLMQGYKVGQMPAQMQRQNEQENLENAFRRMRNQQAPEQFQRQAEQDELANALNRQKLEQGPKQFQSEQELNQAKLGELQNKATLPFGGEVAPGSVGQAMWLNMIKQKYGPQSPEYMDAKKSFESDLQSKNTLNQYRSALTENTDKRFSTGLAKDFLEKADIDAGFMPGTNRTQQLSPDQQQEMSGQYDLKIQKGISDTQTRQKVLNATNAEITMNKINPGYLLQYSGPMGQAKLKRDQALSATGKPPEDYIKYKQSVTNAQLWAKQLRQTYGDSIQPAMLERLEHLTNPTTWFDDPKVALAAFNEFKDTVGKELKTFKGALKSTKPYGENKEAEKENKKATMRYNPSTGTLEVIK